MNSKLIAAKALSLGAGQVSQMRRTVAHRAHIVLQVTIAILLTGGRRQPYTIWVELTQ